MRYWIISYWRILIAILRYIGHIVFNVKNYTEEWSSFVKRDILQYDYIRNALISITTSYLITILVKLDTLISIELTATFLLSWFLLFLSTLLFLRIFFVFRNFEEAWKATDKKGNFEEMKFNYSLSKIMSENEEIKFVGDEKEKIVELISKRWINLIRLFIIFVFASILILIFSSIEGFLLKKSSNTSKKEMESISVINNKIDTLILKIKINQEERKIEFDSLRSSIIFLENLIPSSSIKLTKKKLTN